MKFAHIADCHIGGWSDPKMKQLSMDAFKLAMEKCLTMNVDFILISGDIFNTALPQIDLIRDTVEVLKKVNEHNVNVYIIPGSHDFSPSGKTMLEVLEKAGLCINVAKVVNNEPVLVNGDGFKIAGMLGRRGGLEKEYYKTLNKEKLENADGFKIFMFHSALEELMPKDLLEMEAMSMSYLPKNFHYYAGGHVHSIMETEYNNGIVVYPGALFPNNFKEIEEFKHGGFYVVNIENNNVKKEYVPIKLKEVVTLKFNADDKTALQLYDEILDTVSNIDSDDKIVLMRVSGNLKSGKPSDIDFKEIFNKLDNAYFVMKNTNKLVSNEFSQKQLSLKNVQDVEPELIEQHVSQSEIFDDEKSLITTLMSVLNKEKGDGEKNSDFETRIFSEIKQALNLNKHFETLSIS